MANLQVGVAGNGTVTVGAGASVHSPASNELTLGTNNAERLRITGIGSVGIGTLAPHEALHVYHATANGVAQFESGDATTWIGFRDSTSTYPNLPNIGCVGDDFRYKSGGTERLRITSSGHVGVTSASPVATRFSGTVSGLINLAGTKPCVYVSETDSKDSSGTNRALYMGLASGTAYAGSNAPFSFATGDTTTTERVRIRTDGRVSIASSLAVAGICTAATFVPTDGQLGYRNVIVNGSMMIAQRATSKTVSSGVGGVRVLDRWQTSIGGDAEYTLSQSADEPGGFMNSLKLDCTTADTSLAASDTMRLIYKGEGYDVQRFGKGTSRALSATLSFWIKTNKTGNYQVNWRDIANGRMVGAQYTVSQADTWERKEITFPNETSNGELYNNSNQGLYLEWWFTSGSTTNSGAVPTAWEAYATGDRAAGLNVNLADSTSNELYLTGVQFEVGTAATPFEHISFENELRRCQRYYEKSYPYSIEPGTSGDNGRRGRRVCASATNQTVFTNEQYQVRKRATPTVVTYSNNGDSGKVMLMDYGSTTVHANSSVYGGCDYGFEVSGSGTANAIAVFWTADAEI